MNKFKNQIYKLLITLSLCTFLLFAMELIFQLPEISTTVRGGAFKDKMGVKFWITLWVLLFLQVTIIPIPSMPIYIFCNGCAGVIAKGNGLIDLFSWQTLFFTLFTTSACLAGSVVAYCMGRLGGRKAVKWIAGDEADYNVWCKKLNGKFGKYVYAITVLLPIFPDDIICLVVGAMKMDFKFFTFTNIIGRFIGIVCTCIFMRLPMVKDFLMSSANGGFPWALLIYFIVFVFSISATIFWKRKVISNSCIGNSKRKNKTKNF